MMCDMSFREEQVGGTPQPDGTFNLGDVLVIYQKALGLVSF